MQVIQILAGIALVCLAGCTRAAELRDQFRMADYPLPFDKRLRAEVAAPIIVLGRVLAVDEVGGPKTSPGDSRIKTQLTQIKIAVEETIKGSVSSNPTEFYFFTYSSQNHTDLGVPRYMPEVGQHRIYFLKPWGNTYRSIGDVTDYSLPVRSGTRTQGFCKGKEPGCCMAEILLIPTVGAEIEWFVRELGLTTYAAGVLCSSCRAQELLKQLSQNPDVRIANSAMDIMPLLEQWWPPANSPEHKKPLL